MPIHILPPVTTPEERIGYQVAEVSDTPTNIIHATALVALVNTLLEKSPVTTLSTVKEFVLKSIAPLAWVQYVQCSSWSITSSTSVEALLKSYWDIKTRSDEIDQIVVKRPPNVVQALSPEVLDLQKLAHVLKEYLNKNPDTKNVYLINLHLIPNKSFKNIIKSDPDKSLFIWFTLYSDPVPVIPSFGFLFQVFQTTNLNMERAIFQTANWVNVNLPEDDVTIYFLTNDHFSSQKLFSEMKQRIMWMSFDNQSNTTCK